MADEVVEDLKASLVIAEEYRPVKGEQQEVEGLVCAEDSSIILVVLHAWKKLNDDHVVEAKACILKLGIH